MALDNKIELDGWHPPGWLVTGALVQHDEQSDVLVTFQTNHGDVTFTLPEAVAEQLFASLSLTLRMEP